MPNVNRKAKGKHTQSVIFLKAAGWTKASSRKWLKSHKGEAGDAYYTDGHDETDDAHRWRQYDPNADAFAYRNKVLKENSIMVVLGFPKKGQSASGRLVVRLAASSLFAPCVGSDGELLAPLDDPLFSGLHLDDIIRELAKVGYDEKLGSAGGLRGVVIAEARLFANRWRGRFNRDSLKRIVELWPADGLKSLFEHPSVLDTGLASFLGRMRDPRISRAVWRSADGQTKTVPAVRADLHFDASAAQTPRGDLSGYLVQRAESDPGSFATSLQLVVDEIYETDAKGKPLKDKEGPLPPLWMPVELRGSDIVGAGEVVSSVLGGDGNDSTEIAQGPGQEDAPEYDPRRDPAWRRRAWRAARGREGVDRSGGSA